MQRHVNTILIATFGVGFIILILIISNSSKTYHFSSKDFPKHQEMPAVAEKKPEIIMFFAGDIMLSRNVSNEIEKAQDIFLPFKNMAKMISGADIAFANLESPFSDKGQRVMEGLVFKAEPSYIKGLVESGFDILSTANNHALDQGAYGVEYTLNILSQNGLVGVGSGTNCHDGKVIEKNSIKVGFLAYSYAGYNDGGNRKSNLVCDLKDPNTITSDVLALKKITDLVVVSMHGGIEYVLDPNETQIAAARSAIDGGADLVIGHHPHWVQIAENYKNKWIYYSLGNFIFDQMWSQETREGLTLQVKAQKTGITDIQLKPIIIDNYCCARLATDKEAVEILKKANLTQQPFIDKN